MSINNNTDILNNVMKEINKEVVEASSSLMDKVSQDLSKIASHTIPDSPPTVFSSANSSPNQNISEKEDSCSNINQLYSMFSRINDETKNKELQNFCYPLNYSALTQNTNQLLPPSLINNGINKNNEINSVDVINSNNTGSNDNDNEDTLIGEVCGGNNCQREIPGLSGVNTNNGGFGIIDNNILKNGIDFSNLYNQYLNSQIDWSNYNASVPYNLNSYYQQLALYNRILVSMYLPILGSGYSNSSNNLNPYLPQLLSSSNQSATSPSTYTQNCMNMGSYSDIQTNQFPKMISLASLSQLYQNSNLSALGNNIGGIMGNCNGIDANGNFIGRSLSTSNSPINSSHSLASLLSPINTSQTNTSRSSILNHSDNNYDLSTLGAWGPTHNDAFESSINQNSISNYTKLSQSVKSLGRKTERTRKYTKNSSGNNNGSNVGARRKIDKNSAICIVCGTTQTSQWRFLNLGELFSSNCNKDENSPLKVDETHGGDNCDSNEHIGSSTSNNSSHSSTIIDKQICCNACYMKYDKNRPRYRNGKKVPPPLPTYLYTHGQITNKSNTIEPMDDHLNCTTNNGDLKNELISSNAAHTN
ncbi:hypothetical protein FG379_000623 [Cryptosporidium bovis]|uniref:uncharacterized protein n=1 Tax=Cryptosporidium bovis TaxID=310047 RepID=UPI00351A8D76|nr:hypothetical protein FG379_000623 [Cryptosporidium bovis]